MHVGGPISIFGCDALVAMRDNPFQEAQTPEECGERNHYLGEWATKLATFLYCWRNLPHLFPRQHQEAHCRCVESTAPALPWCVAARA